MTTYVAGYFLSVGLLIIGVLLLFFRRYFGFIGLKQPFEDARYALGLGFGAIFLSLMVCMGSVVLGSA